MTEPIAQGYEPAGVEDRWYAIWEARGYFHADPAASCPPYCIVIPPPNVTGSLHMGHALNNTLQDILIRWRRMQGSNTLWMPGTDHAGIATQNVVERQLAQEGLTRDDVGREAFIARVWRWRQESGGTIIRQLKKLGASCDWVRECFTMDAPRSRAVTEAFVQLFEDGLLYRAERLVNWCPRCGTALADIEVVHEESEGRLWSIRYPVADASREGVVVATTRPETMLGDTAVAVHPEDERYRGMVGREVILPLVGRRLPVVADPAVDREFGTGAVKVTPGHDPTDFEIGERHGLLRLNALTPDGRIGPGFLVDRAGAPLPDSPAATYVGADRLQARRQIVRDLQAQGLLVKEEPHRYSLGHCYRCQTVIEPYLTPQWWVRIQPLAEPAIKAVEEERVRIVPAQWKTNYYEWMRNIHDWCISRQIWWGHQVPAWYCLRCDPGVQRTAGRGSETGTGGEIVTVLPEARPLVARSAPERCPHCGSAGLTRDPDVLDTWFSSALWPFSTLGWPERTPELAAFYPTSTLVTGFDILFFWVARMIMMGLRVMREVPFREVHIHALVRDAEGQKMSKSRGNVIDPLIMIDRYGADALRFTLAALAAQGRDIRLSEERIQGSRHFCNKVWNAYRFVAMRLEGFDPAVRLESLDLTLPDRWILARLNAVTGDVTRSLEQFRFNDGASALYQFLWHEYCDWYVELCKDRLTGADPGARRTAQAVLVRVLDQALRLLHPYVPFITEEIWQRLPHGDESITVASWPAAEPRWDDPVAVSAMTLVMEITRTLRNIRSEMNIPSSRRLDLVLRTTTAEQNATLERCRDYLRTLARVEKVEHGPAAAKPTVAAAAVIDGMDVYVPLEGLIDIDGERARLQRELARVERDLDKVARKLENADFLRRAPAEVVEKQRREQAGLRATRERLSEHLTRIEGFRR